VSADTEALLATVREALPKIRDERLVYTMTVSDVLKAHPALDSLAAELETLKKYGPMTAEGHVVIELHALKEMEAELEQERRWANAERSGRKQERTRADNAEAELERVKREYEEALQDCEQAAERVKAERDGFRDEAAEQQMRWLDEHGRLDRALAALRYCDEHETLSKEARDLIEAEIEGEAT